ncbi:YaiI/YqxD family protein [Cohaesibacter haloalkalitolerans]|uniref:YaiI/YqxD family protein n=1 Tax=Cohaesibacter haloalkalitolerans TaxID=1162980 RepID=UPI001FE0545E|nr:YaiI/YqxD family protein [Cohaesibacter haloalkalitolerans]
MNEDAMSKEQTAIPEHRPVEVLVDADACPVKEEVYKVAERHGVPVTLVANQFMRMPRRDEWAIPISFVKVEDGPDVADDHIAAIAHPRAVVVTADILLAQRCLAKGACVIGTTGKPFTENSIGSAVAMRNLMADLRETSDIGGGPPPFSKADRSRFLSSLHEILERLKRTRV